jgi:methylenetetrahydrofolate dehydrogenase (NADP+)/methenyltetrahydrofolate cyclohydrolase
MVRVDMLGASTSELVQAVERLARQTDGIIVQLPLPESVDTDLVLASIPSEKDVDANGTSPIVDAPVAGAVAEILSRSHVSLEHKKVLIAGHGRLVGKPVEKWFQSQGVPATIVTDTDSLATHAPSADIIILGVGEPGLLRPDMIREGAVVIDAGTAEMAKKLVGDADPTCASKCAVFTPVPGGVGPIAVAMIFQNLFSLMKLHHQ